MNRNLSAAIGVPFFVVGAVGMAYWVWVKRRQLAVAAAKAVPGRLHTEAVAALAN